MEAEILENEIKMFPKLRFGEFHNAWNSQQLRKITSYVDYRGRGPEKADHGIFLVTAKNIKKGFIDYECSKEYIPIKNRSIVMSKGLPEVGDVLFTTEAPLGNVAQVDNCDIALAQRVIKFRGTSEILNDYLLYFMISPGYQKLIYRKAIGTTVLGISGKELHKTKINFPSLPEQQKIASFLSAVDKKIQQLSRKKELLESYKKGVMQKLFSREIQFKDNKGEEFPEWEKKKLSNYLEVSKAKNLELKFDKTNVLSVSGQYGIVNQIEFQGRSFAGESVHNYGVVETGDIVYTKSPLKSNPYGIIKVNKGKSGIVSTLYAVYKCKPSLRGKFLEYYFQLDDNTNRYLRPLVQKGSKNDMKINNHKVLIDPVVFPSVEEQSRIVEYLEKLDAKIDLTNKELILTKTFKKGLLQQMLV